MPQLTNAELAAGYADLRKRCTTLGRSLTAGQANALTPCCPEWSVKDTLAHLTGITTDILTGNLEGAATEPWADAQVQARRGHSMEEVCAEWEKNAPAIDEILLGGGNDIDPRFFVDAWTHEWDIRQATGVAAKPDMRFIDHAWSFLITAIEERNGAPVDPDLDRFEMARMSMGRRSRAQIEAQGLNPDGIVLWTANAVDISDPVSG